MQKVIVILGQTTTGKSNLAVKIAKKFNGEVIGADSRQVYKGLNIGTGKITESEKEGVPHYLIDVIDPKRQFTVVRYKKLAEEKIKEILSRNKIPIICGGTGFYLDAVTKGIVLPKVPPNKKLRKDLTHKSIENLFEMLERIDPNRAKNIDPKNKVRLIRAIEIAKTLGSVPDVKLESQKYDFVKIGLKVPEETLKRRIRLRLRKRLRAGMAIELYDLRRKGVPWRRFMELGFDQKYVALYLQKKLTNKQMLENLFKGNWRYAKRQMTWFKRDKEIKWFDVSRNKFGQILTYLKEML